MVIECVKNPSYIKLDVFSVNPSDDLDDLFEAEGLLGVVLVAEGGDPGQDPGDVHVDLVLKLVELLLDASLSLTDLPRDDPPPLPSGLHKTVEGVPLINFS